MSVLTYLSWYFSSNFVLKSILSGISIASLDVFWLLLLTEYILFHSFNLLVSLTVHDVSCRQRVFVSCFQGHVFVNLEMQTVTYITALREEVL